MDILKKIFPFSFKTDDVAALIVSIIIYLVLVIIGGLAIWLLAKIPVVNILAGTLGALLDLYGVAGIVIAVLTFTKVLK